MSQLGRDVVRVRPRSARALGREALLVVAVYAVYSVIRNLAPQRSSLAEHNAWNGLRLEESLRIDVEHGINDFVVAHPWIAVPANYFYATLFLPAVIGTLVWLWIRRPQVYSHYRTALVVMTLIGLICFWLYPLAPPRLLPGAGFVDTVPYFHTWGMDSSGPSNTGVSNQYAAMPSLHFGWSLWCGTTLWRCASRVWQRVVGFLYPLLTLLVILATANHYLLDAVAGAIAFLAADRLVTYVERRRVGVPEARRG
ncbi:MAG TPA: phosphatase PAP2 family protein [Luteimicrobium sp.]|jgi:hypothetical protein|nr:phosphatase PAP2 family protein [Luteimicrobium sp.]